MKKLIAAAFTCAALAVCANDVPEVSGITMTQGSGSRLVTITYNLANAPAVVTLDIQTNANGTAWASIGGENIQNVSGDVWKKVAAGDNHTITWHPDLSWPNHKIADGGARAVVTAWSVDNPPDYMVVNLASNAVANSETYYPAVEFLPGGLLSNSLYRTSSLVMRKIPAKGVTWAMGSAPGEIVVYAGEDLHTVTLTNNYYIAVFETTQTQWALIQTANKKPSGYSGLMRPVEQVSYNDIRSAETDNTTADAYDYPNPPNPKSFLGLLRAKTGLAFDLPSEAQWEFACRAGHGAGTWGDGSLIVSSSKTDANLSRLGRYYYDGGKNGYTADVGSYAPNSWGIYDMHGNVWEVCLDWKADDITKLNGAVNTTEGTSRVGRGGCWVAGPDSCRSAIRGGSDPGARSAYQGFRVALPLTAE